MEWTRSIPEPARPGIHGASPEQAPQPLARLRLTGVALLSGPDAVAALYPLFRGDLRSLLAALEEGIRLLVGTVPAGESLPLDLLRPALRERYTALLRERLDERGQQQLEAWAAMGAYGEQTQQTLQQAWGLSQSKVSKTLVGLEQHGYVVALPREGRAPIRYVFTGVSQLIFG